MLTIIESSLANSTNNTYFSEWKNWVESFTAKQEVKSSPSDPFNVAIYFNIVLSANDNRGSLSNIFYGIRWDPHVVRYSSPTYILFFSASP